MLMIKKGSSSVNERSGSLLPQVPRFEWPIKGIQKHLFPKDLDDFGFESVNQHWTSRAGVSWYFLKLAPCGAHSKNVHQVFAGHQVIQKMTSTPRPLTFSALRFIFRLFSVERNGSLFSWRTGRIGESEAFAFPRKRRPPVGFIDLPSLLSINSHVLMEGSSRSFADQHFKPKSSKKKSKWKSRR